MANLAITAVQFTEKVSVSMIKLAQAAAIYDIVYDSGNEEFSLADATAADKAAAKHMILMAGAIGDWVPAIALKGNVIITSTPAIAQATKYVVSATGGKIAPRADLVTTGQIITELGDGLSAGSLQFALNQTGIAIP